jgi:glycosyltransferase involved in cell wall biosynthesis
MARPSISVIMCVHNRERFLEPAMRSVLDQSRRDLEFIVWDDGSTDGSRDIIARLAKGDPRVRAFFEPNRGAAAAIKLAHHHASAHYLGWVDSDDLLLPDALKLTAQTLDTRPSLGMVYTDHIILDEAGRSLGLGKRCQIPYSPERLLVDFMTFHFRLFRRDAFEKAGGINDSFDAAHDYDFCLRLSEVATIGHLPKPLYAYRVHTSAISSQRRLLQIESAARAIREALSRRGLAETHELDVEIVGRYAVRPKSPPPNS